MKYITTFLLLLGGFTFLFAQDDELNDKMITAAAKGELTKVHSYVKKGADVNAKNKARWTALAYACKYDFPDIVKNFLENKAEVNGKGKTGSPPLFISLNQRFF